MIRHDRSENKTRTGADDVQKSLASRKTNTMAKIIPNQFTKTCVIHRLDRCNNIRRIQVAAYAVLPNS
jgi:hypothetical protein